MTQDEIIEMAKQAGAKYYGTGEEGVTALMLRDEAIEAFAKLVAAKEREACAKACAKACDDNYVEYEGKDVLATWCSKVIRARGEV